MSSTEPSPHELIPTLSKSKISSHLSYPIGAEAVSAATASASQFAQLQLRFYFLSDDSLRRGHYEFLRAEYRHAERGLNDWTTLHLYRRPPQYRWEIVVQPVPRVFRNRIKQHILDSALPHIASWLSERSQLESQGSDILAFFFDEKTSEVIVRRATKLEPNRTSSS